MSHLKIPKLIHYTTISWSQGRSLGFGEDELGEFDDDVDIVTLEQTLRDIGITPVRLPWGGKLLNMLSNNPPPLIWNLNSGISGPTRTAHVPALCEMLGIPLIGSGSWTASLTQDKTATICYLRSFKNNLCFPKYYYIHSHNVTHGLSSAPFKGPYVVKPNNDESSRGLHYIDATTPWAEVEQILKQTFSEWGPLRLEQYIPGIDVSANAVVNAEGILQPIEPLIIPHQQHVYDGKTKATIRHKAEPLKNLSVEASNLAKKQVEFLCQTLKFKHYARFDFRYTPETDKLTFLEANLCPSFMPEEDFTVAANFSGFTFSDMLRNIIAAGFTDYFEQTNQTLLPTKLRTGKNTTTQTFTTIRNS